MGSVAALATPMPLFQNFCTSGPQATDTRRLLFCPHCARPFAANALPPGARQRCTGCGYTHFLNPAPGITIILHAPDGRVLIGKRAPQARYGGQWCLPGGYIEYEESFIDTAHREVREEVGVVITNLRYFHSQPWPFPDSLMIAFFADYVSGEITPDPSEIEAAGWFPRSALPPLPDPVSIARQLIDAACRK